MQALLVTGFVLLLTGCTGTRPNPGVCCTSVSNCAELGLDTERPCDFGFVCDAHHCREPIAGQCVSDTECPSSTSHCAPDGTCVECLESADCPSSAPACSDRACVACLADAQCGNSTPVCDIGAHECRRCEANAECTSHVCNSDGTCELDAAIAYATPNGSDASPCTAIEPCSIAHAFDVTTTTRRTVHLAAGTYAATLVISGHPVRVVGDSATLSNPAGSGSTPILEVRTGAQLEISDLAIVDSRPTATAILCQANGATVSLDHVDLDAQATGVLADGCNVGVKASHFRGHATGRFPLVVSSASGAVDRTRFDGLGQVVAALGALRISNSVVALENGSEGPFAYSFLTPNKGAIFLSFSTIATSTVKCNDTVTCNGANPVGLCLDNSIVTNPAPGAPLNTVVGPGCQASFSILFPQFNAPSGANNRVGLDPQLVAPLAGDFHLKVGSPAVDTADPATTNAIDFEGTPRPQGGGRDIGAFELKP